MFTKFRRRYFAFLTVILVMFGVLIAQYYHLMLGSTTEETAAVADTGVKSISVKGMRGSILDVNGIPLAYNEASYNIEFIYDVTKKASSDYANYTQIFLQTIELVEKNGGDIIDTFLIARDDETGAFGFDVGDIPDTARAKRILNWCINMYLVSTTLKPEDNNSDLDEKVKLMYAELRKEYGISEDVEDQQAQALIAEGIYNELRTRYRIPEQTDYETAVKLLSIWQEVQLISWRPYLPVTIAYDVDYQTVLEIEMRANELTGMSIAESSVRVYPKNSTAAHIIGYQGRITAEDDTEEYTALGYDIDNDLVGKEGIEATMESYLTGSSAERQGERLVEVDNRTGMIVEELSSTTGKRGDTVVLTIDLEMQEVLDKALADNIERVYEMQQEKYLANKESYDAKVKNRTEPEVNMCVSGAAIVMDVNTGDVLAMSNYPSYDLNLFTGGITDEDFQTLLEDPAKPMFNNAISSVSVPGSIFKMCTAVAGLMEGEITINEIINDEGPYTKVMQAGYIGITPVCGIEPYFSRHADNQNVVKALRDSCNYYFYEVAYRLGIDRVNEWADKFGLTSKTGIELTGEAKGRVGNQLVMYDNTKELSEQVTAIPLLVYNRIYALLKEWGEERNVEYTDAQLTEAATRILKLAGAEDGKRSWGPEIRTILSEVLDIPERYADSSGWSLTLNQYLTEIIWSPANTVRQGIGATPTQLTPIAVARYIAALANGGKVLEPHVVDKVIDAEGNVVKDVETVIVNDLEIPRNILDAICEGMSAVVSYEDGGTAGSIFRDFEYSGQFVGKTGTGKVSEVDLENNGWFVCFAPFGQDENGNELKPEIAMVVFLPHGYSGGSAGYCARDFLQYYFDKQTASAEMALPSEGTLLD